MRWYTFSAAFEDDKAFAAFVQSLYRAATTVDGIERGVTSSAKVRLPPLGQQLSARNAEIIAKYAEDPKVNSSEKLGKKYGISRERVCQILRPANVIANAQERRAVAKEALKEASKKIRQDTMEAMETKLLQAMELVRGGMSERQAAGTVGLLKRGTFVNTLNKRCRLAGIPVGHGKHKDNTQRRARINAFVAANPKASPEQIVRALRGPEDPTLYTNWIYVNMPELKRCSRPQKD